MKLLFQVPLPFLATGGRLAIPHMPFLPPHLCPWVILHSLLLGLIGNAPTLSSFESYPPHQVHFGPHLLWEDLPDSLIPSEDIFLPTKTNCVCDTLFLKHISC